MDRERGVHRENQVYDYRDIPPNTLNWLAFQAQNELNAYLCEGSPYEDNGNDWPAIARSVAGQCRIMATAAVRDAERESWLELARQYQDAI